MRLLLITWCFVTPGAAIFILRSFTHGGSIPFAAALGIASVILSWILMRNHILEEMKQPARYKLQENGKWERVKIPGKSALPLRVV